jgi:hypothetical protein
MNDDLRARRPEEVFDDHLRLAAEHRFDEDISRNVAPDVVILERRGIFHGRAAHSSSPGSSRRSSLTRPTCTPTG